MKTVLLILALSGANLCAQIFELSNFDTLNPLVVDNLGNGSWAGQVFQREGYQEIGTGVLGSNTADSGGGAATADFTPVDITEAVENNQYLTLVAKQGSLSDTTVLRVTLFSTSNSGSSSLTFGPYGQNFAAESILLSDLVPGVPGNPRGADFSSIDQILLSANDPGRPINFSVDSLYIGVPEPLEWAAIYACICLVFALIRKRFGLER